MLDSFMRARRGGLCCVTLALTLLAPPRPTVAQETAPAVNPDEDRYILPSPLVQQLLATDKNYATLDYMSPDRDHFLIPLETELSTLELMSRPTYRLAELELRPQTDRLWHLDTYGIYDLRIYSMSQRRTTQVNLPNGAFASDFTWSPDGSRIAFLAHLPSHTEVWTADASTGATRSLSDRRVLATIGTRAGQATQPSNMLQWTPEGTIITLLVPEGRGPEPQRNRVPDGPVVRRTRHEPTPTRTFPFPLEDAHDETLFEYYTTSQLAELSWGEQPRSLGEPAMWESISLSPDGRYLLATRIERPFSFRTRYRGFPGTTLILDRQGSVVATLGRRPLNEAGDDDDDDDRPRDLSWRPDGAGLSYLQHVPRDPDPGPDAERPDRIMLATAPFDLDDSRVVAQTKNPLEEVSYSLDGRHAFATANRNDERALLHFDLSATASEPRTLIDFHATDDPTRLPGSPMTVSTSNGLDYALVSEDGSSAYLMGSGYAADFRPQPFVDRLSIRDGSTRRVFEGSKESFDQPLVALDPDLERMVASRESVDDFPDSYLWSSSDGWGENLTNNVDPFPEVTAVTRIDFDFERRDGLKVQGRVSMPVGWEEGDGGVPAIFWTYPREYEERLEYDRAAIRARNKNAFTHMSWLRWSDIWLTQGYALVHPDIPIVGENYNDTYVASLVDAMYAAIRAVDGLGLVDVDRIGHGGHSYGAFATANVLANAPFFQAGIAGDGAYNRTLTPAGFHNEERMLWQAPHTYLEMSPFFRADQIDTPLLLYHGGDDNNTGTFPIQSRRMIHALTTLGKTAVLYEYPYESHTPRAIENKLDLWARLIGFFDEHVEGDVGSRPVSEGG